MLAESNITFGEVLIYILAGLVIGIIARLILPGRHRMSITATIILGVISAVVGGLIWNAVFPDNDGIAWIGSLVVAVALLSIYNRITAGKPGAKA